MDGKIATRSDVAAVDKRLTEMDRVVTESLKGLKPSEIAAVVGMSTQKVNTLLKDWRGLAQNNDEIRNRATVALRNADEHYDKLIKKAYEALENSEFNDSNPQKMAAIKLIADLEKARLDSLHRAGLLEDNDITKNLMETERKQEVLMNILKQTVGPCDRCRTIVQEKLSQITKDIVIISANV
jgi:cytidine deaminase